MKVKILILFLFSFQFNCKVCDRFIQLETSIENKSNSAIKINFYYEGKKYEESIFLKKNEKINNTIFKVDQRIGSPNLGARYVITNGGSDRYKSKFPIDSLIVNFDGLKTKNHIAFKIETKNKEALKVNENRNIFNFESYTLVKLVDEKCKKLEYEAIYTFTEQDFENARK